MDDQLKRLVEQFTTLIQQGDARTYEDLFVHWCAEHVAQGYLHDYPESAAAEGASFEQLVNAALGDATFVANARAQFRFATLKDVTPRG